VDILIGSGDPSPEPIRFLVLPLDGDAVVSKEAGCPA
jgi:hypothetical protein